MLSMLLDSAGAAERSMNDWIDEFFDRAEEAGRLDNHIGGGAKRRAPRMRRRAPERPKTTTSVPEPLSESSSSSDPGCLPNALFGASQGAPPPKKSVSKLTSLVNEWIAVRPDGSERNTRSGYAERYRDIFMDNTRAEALYSEHACIPNLYFQDGSLDTLAYLTLCRTTQVISNPELRREIVKMRPTSSNTRSASQSSAPQLSTFSQLLLLSVYLNNVRTTMDANRGPACIKTWGEICKLFLLRSKEREENTKAMMEEPYLTYFYAAVSSPEWDTHSLAQLSLRIGKLTSRTPPQPESHPQQESPKEQADEPAEYLKSMEFFWGDVNAFSGFIKILKHVNIIFGDDNINTGILKRLVHPEVKAANKDKHMVHLKASLDIFMSDAFLDLIEKMLTELVHLGDEAKVHIEPAGRIKTALQEISYRTWTFLNQWCNFVSLANVSRGTQKLPELRQKMLLTGGPEMKDIYMINGKINRIAATWCERLNDWPNSAQLKFMICNTLRCLTEVNKMTVVLVSALFGNSIAALCGCSFNKIFEAVVFSRLDHERVDVFMNSVAPHPSSAAKKRRRPCGR